MKCDHHAVNCDTRQPKGRHVFSCTMYNVHFTIIDIEMTDPAFRI